MSFLYLIARSLVGMQLGRLRSEQTKDVEIAVLRHQLKGLRRHVKRLHTRRVRLAGVTDHPNGRWVVQRAREFSMERPEGTTAPPFPIRDRDCTFTRVFDDVFAADGTQVITTPVQAPNANAFAERWVRTVRQECLDWMLILARRHLERVRACCCVRCVCRAQPVPV